MLQLKNSRFDEILRVDGNGGPAADPRKIAAGSKKS